MPGLWYFLFILKMLLLMMMMMMFVDAMPDLSRIPLPMPGYQQHKTYGQWFSAYSKSPCTWSSSNNVSNYNNVYSSGGKNALKLQLSWQSGEFCNTVTIRKIMVSPGVYLVEDGIGDMISGKAIVVATDYTRSHILWGCTKFSVFEEKCEDPLIVIMTRTPNPDPVTIAIINTKLMRIWGITVNDLLKGTHTGACYLSHRFETFYKGK